MHNVLSQPPFILSDPPPPTLPLLFSFDDTHHRFSRDTAHILSKFLKNLISNSAVPLNFETWPEDIYTIPLIREHNDSYFYYIDTHSVVETPDQPSFSIPFTSPLNPHGTFRKTPTLLTFIFLLPLFSPHF